MTQLARLTSALTSRPNDPFLHYAIAMEHLKSGQVEMALDKFLSLRNNYPQYVATYLQYGNALYEFGQADQAKEILAAGIIVARQVGDTHSAGEIAEALEKINDTEF